ncbi:serine/threonine protein kinase [Stieleria sp. JC731]|uniref:serine/threonine protein kinase n=1 Tax=Pirellulaceae TaxID=2691357 RepID=UPI001E65D1CC|nr:serine/threonine-protein kinase [Stieleria sp. JC731]MCC9601424.1 serine/threonine protein kinase [Stieleria sp. JC731]
MQTRELRDQTQFWMPADRVSHESRRPYLLFQYRSMEHGQTPTDDETVIRRASSEPSGAHASDALPKHGSSVTATTDDVLVEGLDEAKTIIRQIQRPDSGARSGRTPAEIAKVLVGKQLNQYYLDALIGGGGMGAVFRAHDQRLDRIVALKVIPFVGNDPELQRRFRNEAQNAAKLDHPRIARVFDAGDYDDWHYIVFEYIHGINLRDLVQDRGVLSLDDAVLYTSQVTRALEHASQRGIVHRDIKPSNLLVSEDGSVKLVDMGLARSDNLELSEDMTASGVTLGTFDYISPEQALDPRDADIRSDLYSLGCTLYFMLTGEPPYTGGTMLQKLISHGNAPLPDPRSMRPDLPEEVVAVMHRMMAKDPKARYQTASDLLADLRELAYRFDLNRARAGVGVPVAASNDGLQRLQFHLPWMLAALLILMVAGYLELQSTATREAFIISRPQPALRGASANSADVGQAASPLNDSSVPNDSAAVGDGNTASSAIATSVPGNPTTEKTSTQERPPVVDADGLSEAAALPPRFTGKLPFPNEIASAAESNTAPKVNPKDSETVRIDRTMDANRPNSSDANVTSKSATPAPSSGNGTSSTATAAIALPASDVVRVVPPSLLALASNDGEIDRDTDGAALCPTLDEALKLADRLGVNRIQLATPRVVTGKVVIPRDNMVIESTLDRTMIRMVSTDTLAIGRSEMMVIGSHRTHFKNIDFHWELAQEQVDGGSMFVMNDNRLSEFENCSFTLVNKAIHDGVCFFQVKTQTDAIAGAVEKQDATLPLVALVLNNAVVRGEADFIKMDQAAALQLVWNNGLLAVSGRMIDTAGAGVRPVSLITSTIQLSLSNVTAEIPRGVLRMRLGPNGSYPVSIEREANQCVFLVDEGQPHFEIIGVESLATEQDLLRLRGEDNVYVGAPTLTDPILYVADIGGNTAMYLMSELNEGNLAWINENGPRWSVRWSNVRPTTQTYHLLTPATYRQDGAIFFGFRELDLPSLP